MINSYKKENTPSYKEIIKEQYIVCDGDNKKAAENIKYNLERKKLTYKDRASNLVSWATFMYLDKNFEEFESNFKYIESLLIKNEYFYELVHLYSMITSIYTGRYEYENAYIYLYNSELLVSALYEKDKNKETLSTLLAIRYLKANIELDLALKTEADKTFEDAEFLRKKNTIRDRLDIFRNISNYYYKKDNYIKAEKYALKTLELAKNKKENRTHIYMSKIILANAYLENKEPIDKVLELLKDIEINFNIGEELSIDKYLLYAKFCSKYNIEDKEIEYLEKSYKILKSKNEFLKSLFVLEKLINFYEENNNKEALYELYKECTKQSKKHKDIHEFEFAIANSTNSDIIEATLIIKELKNQNDNLIYIDLILLILVISIILVLYKYIYLSRHDMLTKVYNRGYFNNMYKKYNKNNNKYSLIIFDIDNFKNLNDMYGHSFGDDVLIEIAKNIKNSLDKECKLFRYGGEEFVILVDSDSTDYALRVAEIVRANVEKMIWKENVNVTISVGMSYSGDNVDNMLVSADSNLYKSKKDGKNRVTYIN